VTGIEVKFASVHHIDGLQAQRQQNQMRQPMATRPTRSTRVSRPRKAANATEAIEVTKTIKAPKDPEQKRGTRRIPIFLSEEQIAWLKRDKDGASAAVRALITEAMAMENLARSVGRKGAARKKK
jgi:hypothetical protein